MSAVDIVDQVGEFITRDCLLVVFENIPSRLVAKDTNVLSSLKTSREDRYKQARRSSDSPSQCFDLPNQSRRRIGWVNA